MLQLVRVIIVLLTLNIIDTWITPNWNKGMCIIKRILIWWEYNLHCLTGQKNSWYKIKASQLRNYGILLNLKFMKSEISPFQNNWVELHQRQATQAMDIIKECSKCFRCWKCPTYTNSRNKVKWIVRKIKKRVRKKYWYSVEKEAENILVTCSQ